MGRRITMNKKLIEFLDSKLENAQSYAGWFWLQGVSKIEQYLNEDGSLDEITMQGEFNEEIDIIKEWIQEWKEV
tara:strand:- start:297 stop:518 length:222 start_codon:yes stop_codon:yes gene_type:complete